MTDEHAILMQKLARGRSSKKKEEDENKDLAKTVSEGKHPAIKKHPLGIKTLKKKDMEKYEKESAEAYYHGLIVKCAELDVNPEQLMKIAQKAGLLRGAGNLLSKFRGLGGGAAKAAPAGARGPWRGRAGTVAAGAAGAGLWEGGRYLKREYADPAIRGAKRYYQAGKNVVGNIQTEADRLKALEQGGTAPGVTAPIIPSKATPGQGPVPGARTGEQSSASGKNTAPTREVMDPDDYFPGNYGENVGEAAAFHEAMRTYNATKARHKKKKQ